MKITTFLIVGKTNNKIAVKLIKESGVVDSLIELIVSPSELIELIDKESESGAIIVSNEQLVLELSQIPLEHTGEFTKWRKGTAEEILNWWGEIDG